MLSIILKRCIHTRHSEPNSNVAKLNYIAFPSLNNANEDGLLAMGGDLTLDTLVSAYSQGIFPWFNNDQPLLWWSPDPRLVLYPDQLVISKSMAKVLRQKRYRITCDQSFQEVIKACALRGETTSNNSDNETWITADMHKAYNDLFKAGYAHSIEVWQDQTLVGGLYGVVLGKVFFGESMFSKVSNASKLALISLCQHLKKLDFDIVDCQVASSHLFSLGAVEIPRKDFMTYLKEIDIQQNSNKFAIKFQGNDLLDLRNLV